MDITVKKLEVGTRYRLYCADCHEKLADYSVYVENGLMNPRKDFYTITKNHLCPGKPL
jgi:hypothetical protein